MKFPAIVLAAATLTFAGFADGDIQALWPESGMPDSQAGVAAPYLEWSDAPATNTGSCVIIVAGSDYAGVGDGAALRPLERKLLDNGVTCVWLHHRPSLGGLPAYKVAWEDGQRAVRLVRQAAAERGYGTDKIGVMGYSAGAHLSLLLATSSQTAAYSKVDSVDDIACNVNFAMPISPTDVLVDALAVDPVFKFDTKTCATCLFHGEIDTVASPLASTRVYRKIRMIKTQNGIRLADAEVHLDPDRGHDLIDADTFERGIEFMRQKGFLGDLPGLVGVFSRFPNDSAQSEAIKIKNIWPEGKTPDYQSAQHQWSGDDANPWIEWHLPKNRTTDAILILYAGGGYNFNKTGDFEVVPVQRYFVEQGLTVVSFHYRSPRPAGLPKHMSAWQDLQRAIRLVRAEAPNKGLDPQKIGLMGHSAGGHLTLMGATTSQTAAYSPIDDIDQIPCNVQFAIALFPAYAITDGLDGINTNGGDPDWVSLASDFAFDSDTCPMLFLHGDTDQYAAMNSVICWEKLRSMGIRGEVHTLATAQHDFFQNARPGTGSYHYNERAWDFIQRITGSSQAGGTWGEPTFTWTETASGYDCTATSVSTGNPALTTNETVAAVLQATKSATTTTAGAGYYAAVFSNLPFAAMATKDVTIPMLDVEPAPGVDITVPIAPSGDATGAADTQKIQDHLNAAARVQGTVTLEEGTFYLNAQLVLENGATLAGQGYDKTVVKQTANARCVVIDGGAKLERVTLTGGKVSTMYECGGGAWVRNGTISWCCITNNVGSNHYVYGCGVGFSEGQGTIDHSIVMDNRSTTVQNVYGAGIGALNTAGPVIVDTCLIAKNTIASGGSGAGIGIKNEHVALVVRNCTIADNVASNSSAQSGGIRTEGGWGPVTVVNTIAVGNLVASSEGNFVAGHEITSDSRNCLFGLSTEGTSIAGVMYGDPVFVGAANGDYHLGGGSDAIGAGAAYAGLGVDLDNVSFAAAPSVGCYEYAGAEPPAPHVHAWGAPTYSWTATASGYDCTATAVCAGNSSHVTNETVTAAYEIIESATTEASGTGRYTATFASELFTVQTKDVVIPKLEPLHEHAWGEPSYSWSAGNGTCTATAVCTGNSSHVTNETVTATYEVVEPATTEATGTGRYTATFTSALFVTQTKDVVIPVKSAGIEPGASAAATRQTIQDAIDAAAPTHGVVVLGSGLFEIDAQLNVTGGVTLVGQGWEHTVVKRLVDTSKWTVQRCVMLDDGAKLEGVVLTGGDIRAQSENGGGALVRNGTISWCCITNNFGSNHAASGYGVSFSGGQGTIDHSVVSGNMTKGGASCYGAGIGGFDTVGPVVIDTCLIAGNLLGSSGAGGGIGIKNLGGDCVVRNCTVVGNTANTHSAGIRIENRATGNSTAKGVIVNTVLVGNMKSGSEVNYADNFVVDKSSSGNNFFGLAAESELFAGSICGDPCFVNAVGGDYRLGAASAAKNAGASYSGIGVDLDGVQFAAVPSIGCYECDSGALPPPGPSEWDIPAGGEGGGINGLDDGQGGKFVRFTSIVREGENLAVGFEAAKIDANGQLFGLICKDDLADAETFTVNVTLTNEAGGAATVGLLQGFTSKSRLFVVGIGPSAE